ncbi:MAG: hypothetical protein GY870_20390 [archaeon]|nr:hypothetical protein [archaeon]
MFLKPIAYMLKTPWIYKPLIQMTDAIVALRSTRYRVEFERNREKYEAKKRRVLDAISMYKEPDRVPVTSGAFSFFPAKYAGISVSEFMFDHKKMKAAYLKTIDDFDFDALFPAYALSFGRLMTASKFNMFRIPGRQISINSSYQYNEYERLKTDEYDELIERKLDFLIETLVPRFSVVYKMKKIKRPAYIGRTILELLGLVNIAQQVFIEERARGHYSLMRGLAMPPYDVWSLLFRNLTNISRDLMKKDRRAKIIKILEGIEPWITPLFSNMPKAFGSNGIFFASERGFSLSPRQFEQFFWPTMKKMIYEFVKDDNIIFLGWEGDSTHLVHFLLELPKNVARRCCFMVDSGDIFKINKILDGHMALQGNVPLSTMCVGTPKDVEKYCEKMFAELKPGGGFINCSALHVPDEAKPENVHAMINYTKKYGNYV